MPNNLEYENNPEASGFTRRFIACEPRLSEAIELYKESGFEVLLVSLPPKKTAHDCVKEQEKEECLECFNGIEEKYRIIYTRPESTSRENSIINSKS
jgi:hypothetical protein